MATRLSSGWCHSVLRSGFWAVLLACGAIHQVTSVRKTQLLNLDRVVSLQSHGSIEGVSLWNHTPSPLKQIQDENANASSSATSAYSLGSSTNDPDDYGKALRQQSFVQEQGEERFRTALEDAYNTAKGNGQSPNEEKIRLLYQSVKSAKETLSSIDGPDFAWLQPGEKKVVREDARARLDASLRALADLKSAEETLSSIDGPDFAWLTPGEKKVMREDAEAQLDASLRALAYLIETSEIQRLRERVTNARGAIAAIYDKDSTEGYAGQSDQVKAVMFLDATGRLDEHKRALRDLLRKRGGNKTSPNRTSTNRNMTSRNRNRTRPKRNKTIPNQSHTERSPGLVSAPLYMTSWGAMCPKDNKMKRRYRGPLMEGMSLEVLNTVGGEDAFFTDDAHFFVGVADGVSGRGMSLSGALSRWMMHWARDAVRSGEATSFAAFQSMLQQYYQKASADTSDDRIWTDAIGSTTAGIWHLNSVKRTIDVTNMGDSSIFLVRDGKIIADAPQSVQGWNFPDQFPGRDLEPYNEAHGLEWYMDLVVEKMQENQERYTSRWADIQDGDLVIACSDGLADNVPRHVIERILQESDCVQQQAESLVWQAYFRSQSPSAITPEEANALKRGEEWHIPFVTHYIKFQLDEMRARNDEVTEVRDIPSWVGGKPDDIVVVVTRITSKPPEDSDMGSHFSEVLKTREERDACSAEWPNTNPWAVLGDSMDS